MVDKVLIYEKINKSMDSLAKAFKNVREDNNKIAVGDLDFVKENAQEAIWMILNLDELSQEGEVYNEATEWSSNDEDVSESIEIAEHLRAEAFEYDEYDEE